MDLTKLKEKAIEVKDQVIQKAKDVKEKAIRFVEENPGLIIPILSGAGMLVSGVLAAANGKTDEREKMCLVEDDITGQNFKTIRPMTNSEILELGERMVDGQTKGDALNTMGLLKNEKRR